MKQIVNILTITAIVLISCNRIKNKANEIVTHAEHKIKDKSERIIDKALPHFDFDKADTKFNKQRFVEYLQIEVSSDITNIYCFGDFLGADYKVLFSFNCDSLTTQRIINKKGLKLTNEYNDTGLLFLDHFSWWDKDRIKQLKCYKTGKEYEYWQYLWYDKEQKRAYYEEYSL